MKWMSVSRVFCDNKVSLRLKEKLYETVVRPSLLYIGSKVNNQECACSKYDGSKNKPIEVVVGYTLVDSIRKDDIREKVGVTLVGHKMIDLYD